MEAVKESYKPLTKGETHKYCVTTYVKGEKVKAVELNDFDTALKLTGLYDLPSV